MNSYEAMAYITNTYKFGTKQGLDRIRRLLELLGNPQKGMKFVHVAGTNGKGSVCSYMTKILMEAGYKTGLYISPYIQRFSERIRVDNIEITDDEIVMHIMRIKECIGKMADEGIEDLPTEFEVLTTMAFCHYRYKQCDVVVLETGLGGIIDSTNVIDESMVSIITTIGFDHMKYLGETLPEIAEKKAGIIKTNGNVVVYPQPKEVMEVFEKVSAEKNANLKKLDKSLIQIKSETIDGTVFDFGQYKDLEIALLGEHQTLNASLAVLASEIIREKGFNIIEENIRSGLLKNRWAGRFEVVNRNPVVIIDGAHNTEGAKSFCDGLARYFPGKKLVFITGVLQDKDYKNMFKHAVALAKEFITIEPDYIRALPSGELKAYLSQLHDNVTDKGDIKSALDYALENCEKDDVICAFGSLYYIGQVRGYFGLF